MPRVPNDRPGSSVTPVRMTRRWIGPHLTTRKAGRRVGRIPSVTSPPQVLPAMPAPLWPDTTAVDILNG